MVDLRHVLENPDRYKLECERRGINDGDAIVDRIITLYADWKRFQLEFEALRTEQKEFNTRVVSLSGSEKETAINQIKGLSEQVKSLESQAKAARTTLDQLVGKLPSLTWDEIPVGFSDADNVVTQVWGKQPEFGFTPKPYWELPVYTRFVSQERGAQAMGARGFYMQGDMALFQKALFDYVLDLIVAKGFELMYVPLMLNETVLTGTGHIPDFDGQQYEVSIDENKSYYLIGSSEPSIMGYYMDSHVGTLDTPIRNTCWSSCFRKEAGSYGKDQQGIFRVHQFEKIEMVAICKPEQAGELLQQFYDIEAEIYSTLGLYFQAVEVCTGDIPAKHYRQIDFEAWFPYQQTFREVGSNGNASDYQNRGLRLSYTDEQGNKAIPWGLNCTAVTFRTGLALLEQFQQADGSVILPKVLADRMHKTILV